MNHPFTFLNNIYSGNQASRLQEMVANVSVKLEDVLDEDILISEFKEGKAYILDL